MLASAEAIVGAYAKALPVDRAALKEAQKADDVMMALRPRAEPIARGRRAEERRARGARRRHRVNMTTHYD